MSTADRPVVQHDPRCSKSRRTLELLRERGLEPLVVEYLEHPPTAEEVRAWAAALGRPVRELVRAKEAAYREQGLGPESSDDELARAVAAHPVLLERPLVLHRGRAALGRPPEAVLELFERDSE